MPNQTLSRFARWDGEKLLFDWMFIVSQDRVWVDRYGVEHDIDSMDKGYRKRALAFLVRHHGPKIRNGLIWEYMTCLRPSGSMAQDAFGQEFDMMLDSTPEQAVEMTALGRALAGLD